MVPELSAAVAVMARVPRLGQVKTRLARKLGEQAALDLHRAMLAEIWQTASSCPGLEASLWLDDRPTSSELLELPESRALRQQRGDDLGARMYHCLSTLRSSGADACLVVGADCPFIDQRYLLAVVTAIEEGADLVLGPAKDGGYVLLGCSEPRQAWFEGVSWGSGAVLDQTLARARSLGSQVVQMPALADIDEPEDLLELEGRAGEGVAERLRQLARSARKQLS